MLTHQRRDDSGLTLIELLVVASLLAVVGGVVSLGLMSGMRTTSTVQEQGKTAAELRIAIERIARELRAADPVELGTARSDRIQVRIARNGACTRYLYRPSGGDLVQYTETPLSPAPAAVGSSVIENACTTPAAAEPPAFLSLATPPTPRTLATGVSTTGLFAYHDAAGTQLIFPAPAGAPYTEKDIARMTITLVRPASGRLKSVEVSTGVNVRNASSNQTPTP